MLGRLSAGRLPSKHHTVLAPQALDEQSGTTGVGLYYEECLSRRGFDGPYTLLYHQHRPHEAQPLGAHAGWNAASATSSLGDGTRYPALLRRHYQTQRLASAALPVLESRQLLLTNPDVSLSVAMPGSSDDCYFVNADADELVFVHQGAGRLISPLGEVGFSAGDYLCVPKGILHRFALEATDQRWLRLEANAGLALPKSYLNAAGQLRMDAPYSERDFRTPVLNPASDDGLRQVVIKRHGDFAAFKSPHPLCDVVGWDGAVYPFAFSIHDFQPKVASVHLPPTAHATFELGGALVCSFVPRPLDFHPRAIPCPYPHTSVDVDEVLYYVSGDFISRRGIGAGSLTHHPAGIPHGPHPGAYEGSLGKRETDEVAVMLDCFKPLSRTPLAETLEDTDYHSSFVEAPSS